MYYQSTYPLNTFDEVATAYAKIKPMRGTYGGKDVRPIENRRRPAHRVVKVDDSTYVLSNWHVGDPIFGHYWSRTGGKLEPAVTTEEFIGSAPIVWRKHEDGTETVTVRNSFGSQEINHYSFLHSFLPRGLNFCITREGKQYVGIGSYRLHYPASPARFSNDKTFFLPHTTRVPKYVWDDLQTSRANGIQHIGWWNKATFGDDGLGLTFKREGSEWVFVGGGKPETTKRRRVDVEAKKTYKEKINNFFTFILTMRPLLPISDYGYISRIDQEVSEAMGNTTWRGYHAVVRGSAPELSREALDPEHPMHLHFAVFFMRYHMRGEMPKDQSEVGFLRAAFTKWINKTCGFEFTIEEEV